MSATAAHNALVASADEDRANAAPLDEVARARELEEATEDFLLASWPLMKVVRGDKQAHLRAAWARLAAANGRRRLRQSRLPMPSGRRGVALALHRAVLDLCRAYGLTGFDLIEAYNQFVDAMETPKDGVATIKALLALIVAEELVSR